MTRCQSDPQSDNSNIRLVRVVHFVPHVWYILQRSHSEAEFNGWGRSRMSNAIILQNSCCTSKVSEGFFEAQSKQDTCSFGPQGLPLLPSALECLALHTLGRSGSFSLKAPHLNQAFNDRLSHPAGRGGQTKDIKKKCYSYSALAFLLLPVKDETPQDGQHDTHPDRHERAIHIQTFLLRLSARFKKGMLSGYEHSLLPFQWGSRFHCMEHGDTKINR